MRNTRPSWAGRALKRSMRHSAFCGTSKAMRQYGNWNAPVKKYSLAFYACLDTERICHIAFSSLPFHWPTTGPPSSMHSLCLEQSLSTSFFLTNVLCTPLWDLTLIIIYSRKFSKLLIRLSIPHIHSVSSSIYLPQSKHDPLRAGALFYLTLHNALVKERPNLRYG